MSTSNDNVRYVVQGNLVQFNMMMHELMQRNNSGKTEPGKMLKVTPRIMNHSLGLMFGGFDGLTNHRLAWITNSEDALTWLVWYGNDALANTLMDNQGNMVPRLERCCSANFLSIEKAFESVEEYVLYEKYPKNTMPPGHLESLTG